MSIATEIERLQTAKADIKTAIKNKGVEVGDGLIDTYADKIAQISTGDSYYDTFWDLYQENGNRTDYSYLFAGNGWGENTFKPKYNIVPVDASSMFYYNEKLTNIPQILENLDNPIALDFSQCTKFNTMLMYSSITDMGVVDTRSATSINYIFRYAQKLKNVEELILKEDGSQEIGAYAFDRTGALENITITGKFGYDVNMASCTKLTANSIISIVNALSDTVTGQTITLSKTAVNNAFGIDVDDESTYPEGSEFYELIQSKSDWFFGYN